MPSWIGEEGYDWFNKLECKRCLCRFNAEDGEVPIHKCIDGFFKSMTTYNEYGEATLHDPVRVPENQVPKKYKQNKGINK